MRDKQQLSFLGRENRTKRVAAKRKKESAPPQPRIRLSPTTGLNLFSECPRCFYLHHNRGVHRPRGIFPSLPSGMDLVIKDYFDHYRGSVPPELSGQVDGSLVNDQLLLSRWRNWRTGLEYTDAKRNAVLFGALDDCLILDGKYIPLDYKTKGSAPNPGDSERYYQLQLDTYALLLDRNGFPAADHGYLVYYYPEKVSEHGHVTFAVHPVRMRVNPDNARHVFERAVALIRGTDIPKHHTNCEYCMWNEQLREFD